MLPAYADALRRINAIASVPLGLPPTPIEEMARLRAALGGGPRLLVKRDDAIPFGFGGNKVRKLALVVAEAMATGADTLVTVGGVQSNHMRVTASLAARLGLDSKNGRAAACLETEEAAEKHRQGDPRFHGSMRSSRPTFANASSAN